MEPSLCMRFIEHTSKYEEKKYYTNDMNQANIHLALGWFVSITCPFTTIQYAECHFHAPTNWTNWPHTESYFRLIAVAFLSARWRGAYVLLFNCDLFRKNASACFFCCPGINCNLNCVIARPMFPFYRTILNSTIGGEEIEQIRLWQGSSLGQHFDNRLNSATFTQLQMIQFVYFLQPIWAPKHIGEEPRNENPVYIIFVFLWKYRVTEGKS